MTCHLAPSFGSYSDLRNLLNIPIDWLPMFFRGIRSRPSHEDLCFAALCCVCYRFCYRFFGIFPSRHFHCHGLAICFAIGMFVTICKYIIWVVVLVQLGVMLCHVWRHFAGFSSVFIDVHRFSSMLTTLQLFLKK